MVGRDAPFDELLAEAGRTPVDGWDLTRLGRRIVVEPPPWDFDRIVAEHARTASALLDIGTGGGEWLASLPNRPARTVATESWPPNLAVAATRLAPLGVSVVKTDAAPDNVDQHSGETRGRLPFPPESYDLVTSRHASFVASEVARVLQPGGAFLTQQTGGDYGEFYDALGLPRPAPRREWNVAVAREQVAAAGLDVTDSAAGAEATTFADVGAFAWYLRAVPWTVEGFSVERHRTSLERLHRRLQAGGPLTLHLPSFWLKAVKRPGSAARP